MPLAARQNDQHSCPIPPVGTTPAHVGGPIKTIAPPNNVYIEGQLAARSGDICECTPVSLPNPIPATSGSSTVFINGRKAIRIGDDCTHFSGAFSFITTGASKTHIGG